MLRLIILLVFFTSNIYAQDEAYEYDQTEYAEEADEYADEYTYEDTEYEDVDEDAEYEDASEYKEENEEPLIELEESPETQQAATNQSFIIPILGVYKPPITVDPDNPLLPSNHQLKRLRGTIWRGSTRIVTTNRYNVFQEVRQYIFFAKDKDAVAFRYVPFSQKKHPEIPIQFMSLVPLLQTNTYTPIKSPSLKKYEQISSSNMNVFFDIDNRTPTSISNEVVLPAIKIPPQQKPPDSTQNKETPPAETESPEEGTEYETDTEYEYEEAGYEYEEGTEYEGEETGYEYEEGTEYEGEETGYEYEEDGYEYEEDEYETDTYARLKRKKTKFVAQDMEYEYEYEYDYEEGAEYEGDYEEGSEYEAEYNTEKPPAPEAVETPKETPPAPAQTGQYVINVGGNNSGIFIYKSRNPSRPYQVIFLSLVRGIDLYASIIDNSFDVRDTSSQASVEARELYIKILENRLNMQKFQRIATPFELSH